MELDEEDTHFALMLIREHIELPAFIIVNNFLDWADVIGFVEIYPSAVGHVEIDTIFGWSDNSDGLVITQKEEIWLPSKWCIENGEIIGLVRDEIKLDNLLLPGENQSVWISPILGVFERKLHGNEIELRVFSNSNSPDLFKFVGSVGLSIQIFHPFVDEYLIAFILIHDQLLTCNDRQEVLAWRDLHTDDLIFLPGCRGKELNLDLTLFDQLEGIDIVEIDLIYLWD